MPICRRPASGRKLTIADVGFRPEADGRLGATYRAALKWSGRLFDRLFGGNCVPESSGKVLNKINDDCTLDGFNGFLQSRG